MFKKLLAISLLLGSVVQASANGMSTPPRATTPTVVTTPEGQITNKSGQQLYADGGLIRNSSGLEIYSEPIKGQPHGATRVGLTTVLFPNIGSEEPVDRRLFS